MHMPSIESGRKKEMTGEADYAGLEFGRKHPGRPAFFKKKDRRERREKTNEAKTSSFILPTQLKNRGATKLEGGRTKKADKARLKQVCLCQDRAGISYERCVSILKGELVERGLWPTEIREVKRTSF